MSLTQRKLLALLVAEAIAAVVATATIVDLRAHTREEQLRAPNRWGFRGPARLRPLGARVAVVGGAAAYGFGVDWPNSWPYYLDVALGRKDPPADVVNLAATGDGAASYIATLEKYAYLKPDALCIYDAYDAPGIAGDRGVRYRSPVFRVTGYFPILDDLMARREDWNDAAGAVVDPLLQDDRSGAPDVSCASASRPLCSTIADTVAWALARQISVAVVTPPYISRRHETQQASLTASLAERFRGARGLRLLDMGRLLDVRDPAYSFDGVHLTARGNAIVAQNLTDPLFQLLQSRRTP